MSHCSKKPREITRRESEVSCLMYFGILSCYDDPKPKLYLLYFYFVMFLILYPDKGYCKCMSFMWNETSGCLLYMCARIWLLYYSVRYSRKRFSSSWVSAGHRHVPILRILGSKVWHYQSISPSYPSTTSIPRVLNLCLMGYIQQYLDKLSIKETKYW